MAGDEKVDVVIELSAAKYFFAPHPGSRLIPTKWLETGTFFLYPYIINSVGDTCAFPDFAAPELPQAARYSIPMIFNTPGFHASVYPVALKNIIYI